MTTFLMYLLTKLDSFSTLLGAIVMTSGICLVIILFLFFANLDDMNNSYRVKEARRWVKITNRCRKTLLKVLVISTLFVTLLPTTKQAAFIWVAPQIIENGAVKDTVANIPELTKLGTEYLKQMLKDEINDNKNTTTAGENS